MGDFTWANLIALAALMFTGLTALLGVWWKIEVRIREAENKNKHDLRNVEQTYQAKLEKANEQFNEFKLHVAQKYATHDHVKDSESRLIARIDDLTKQVSTMPDVVVERMTMFLKMRSATQ